MKKYMTISILFFLVELFLFSHFQDDLLKQLSSIDSKFLLMHSDQVRAIKAIEKIHKINSRNQKCIYIMGASTGREFFLSDHILSRDIGVKVINLSIDL